MAAGFISTRTVSPVSSVSSKSGVYERKWASSAYWSLKGCSRYEMTCGDISNKKQASSSSKPSWWIIRAAFRLGNFPRTIPPDGVITVRDRGFLDVLDILLLQFLGKRVPSA